MDCFRASPIPEAVQDFFRDVFHDIFIRENTTNVQRIFNTTMLKWHCEYGNQRQECVSKCNGSPYKQEMLELLTPTSYICHESDFMANIKCYRDVYEQDLNDCESGDKCLSYKTAIKNLSLEGSIEEMDGLSREKRIGQIFFNNLCQYIVCSNQCHSEALNHCGRESNQILIEFYRRIVAPIKMLYSLLHRAFKGRDLTFIDTCYQI